MLTHVYMTSSVNLKNDVLRYVTSRHVTQPPLGYTCTGGTPKGLIR